MLSPGTEALLPAPVDLHNGSVVIDGRPIVRGVNLKIGAGEFVALMGANGSGKSTLVRALTGLRPLAAGSLELFGVPLEKFSNWDRIGFVPQRAGAGSGVPASVWEVVASGRLTRRRLLRPLSRDDRAAITEAIALVGLSEKTRAGIATLSGGQQQRVLIARALAGKPDLFFLDEPSAGVDLPSQHALADTLHLLSERGSTVVLVAHELGPMEPLVDRAVVLRNGRVVYDGPRLSEAEVHHPLLGSPGHHHPDDPQVDHVPHVVAPLDTTSQRTEGGPR